MLETFRPLLEAARGVDLGDPAAAEHELTKRFDPRGPAAHALNRELVALLEAGRVATRGDFPVRYGRVSKAVAETGGFSIDVVHMNGAGPRHAHPRGEIDYCLTIDGSPTFDGHPPGWVVFSPGSVHVPTVSHGTMLIVYLLPGGEIRFEDAGA